VQNKIICKENIGTHECAKDEVFVDPVAIAQIRSAVKYAGDYF